MSKNENQELEYSQRFNFSRALIPFTLNERVFLHYSIEYFRMQIEQGENGLCPFTLK